MKGPSGDYALRFKREGRFLLEFVHPRVVRCVAAAEDPVEGGYLVCEFVPGADLSKYVREKGPQPASWSAKVIIQLLAGLHFLHTRPGMIVHRDVKPANVLLRLDRLMLCEAPIAELADLGMARALEDSGSTRLTQMGMVPGTAQYIAPEVFSGQEYGPAADIYSAGIAAYYTVTRQFPFDYPPEAEENAYPFHVLAKEPLPVQMRLPAIPPLIGAAIDKACRKDPGQRHPSALEFAQALKQAD
jgi:serine/threonine-protein kinase